MYQRGLRRIYGLRGSLSSNSFSLCGGSGCRQQFLDVLPGGVRDARTAHHAHEFIDAAVTVQLFDAGRGAAVGYYLFNTVLLIGECGYLSQMSYAENLIATGKILQFLPD